VHSSLSGAHFKVPCRLWDTWGEWTFCKVAMRRITDGRCRTFVKHQQRARDTIREMPRGGVTDGRGRARPERQGGGPSVRCPVGKLRMIGDVCGPSK
jgi:hypothetical protein